MHQADAQNLQGCGAIVVAFDAWRDLRSALETLTAEVGCFKAVLHGGKAATDPAVVEAVDEVTQFECSWPRRNKRSKGGPARPSSAVFAGGDSASAAALRKWLSGAQALHLRDHIEKGRLLLWIQPRTAEQFCLLCARMVRSSPHVVEICNEAS
jgi:hypothetical protein